MKHPLGIVELYKHNEVLTHYCDLVLLGDYPLYVFCNKELFDDLPKRLKNSKISWFLNDSEKTIHKFIKINEASIRECQFLLITTVFSHFKSFGKLASWVRSAVIIHSAHAWLKPFMHIHLRKEHKSTDFLKLIKSILLRRAYLRRGLLKKVKYIGLPNESIFNYVNSNFSPPDNAKFASVPFGAYLGMPEVNTDMNCMTFTITGSIGDDVRDYESVLEAIKLLLPSLVKKLKLVLLGKPRNKEGHKTQIAFQQIKHPLLEIITFPGYISQEAYDGYLAATDYLIMPLKKYTQFGIFRELTCYSKLSGSVNDMIRFGIPTIASTYCTVDEKVDESLIYYSSPKQLADLILELSLKEKQLKSKSDLEHTFSSFKLEKLFNDLILLINT